MFDRVVGTTPSYVYSFIHVFETGLKEAFSRFELFMLCRLS